MSKSLKSATIAAAVQYGALGLGCAMGFARGIPHGSLGSIALLALFVEMLRYMLSPRLGQAHPNTVLLCEALLLYGGWFYNGLFVFDTPWPGGSDRAGLVIDILRLVPFLLAIGPLVRAKAWIRAAGTVVFFTTLLYMIIINSFATGYGFNFLTRWVA